MRRLRLWLRDVFSRRRVEGELDAEIQAHLNMEIDSLIAQGVEPGEARRRARADFGAVDAIKEECREARDSNFLETIWLDVRHGVRMMRRYPLFAGTAVTTLALTIAAVSTVFSLVHTFVLRPLPVPEAERIVYVEPTQEHGTNTGPISYPDFRHFQAAVTSFDELAAIYPTAPLFVTRDGEGRQVNGAVVSENFFRAMRVEPFVGRFFTPDEDAVPERDRVVVVGYDFWQVWFGGADAALGASLRINGVDFTVVGVMPPHFRGVDSEPLNIFMPTMMLPVGYRWCEDSLAPECTVLRMYGRLGPGATAGTAAAEMETLLPETWIDPVDGENSGIRVTAVRGAYMSGVDRQFLELVGWVVGALLLACCANLAGLLASRGRARGHELAVRVSLGAGQLRLVRQLAIESLILAAAGGVCGVALSVAMTRGLTRVFYAMDSSGRPLTYNFDLSPTVVAGTFCVTLLAGLLFGLAPALVTARRGARAALGSTRGVVGADRGQRVLIAGQAAIAVVLVAVAGLFASGAQELVEGRGFDPDRVALLRLRPRLLGYGPDQAQPYLREVLERLDALPQVESVTMVGTGIALMGFRAEVVPEGDTEAPRLTGYIEVGQDYFQTLGIDVQRGREFVAGDDAGAEPVVIVSESAAAALWPGADPVGRILRVRDTERRVVGQVADVLMTDRTQGPMPYVYTPYWQNPDLTDARLQVRVSGDPATALPVLTAAIHEVNPDVPVSETITMSWRVGGLFRPQRLSATAIAYAAGLAVFLSALGLYASLAASVARRRREFGVRQAVGASSKRVLSMVVGQGVAVVAGGVLVGILMTIAATRTLSHLLYTPASADAAFIAVAVALVLGCGVASAWLPARRAARVDPSVSLRAD